MPLLDSRPTALKFLGIPGKGALGQEFIHTLCNVYGKTLARRMYPSLVSALYSEGSHLTRGSPVIFPFSLFGRYVDEDVDRSIFSDRGVSWRSRSFRFERSVLGEGPLDPRGPEGVVAMLGYCGDFPYNQDDLNSPRAREDDSKLILKYFDSATLDGDNGFSFPMPLDELTALGGGAFARSSAALDDA